MRQFIEDLVKRFFDKMRPSLLGDYRMGADGKGIVFTSAPAADEINLQKLFLTSLQSTPNRLTPSEKNVLNDILNIANQYINKLETDTAQKINTRVMDHLYRARVSGDKVDPEVIKSILSEELDNAASHFIKIAQAESTKARNMGTLMNIVKWGDTVSVEDPTVFFLTSKDNKVCEECKRLHLMPDLTTPRLWKVSELKFSYHKKGEDNPSINGLHPHCRCSLTVLAPGFGFDKSGNIVYVGPGHDEYKKQKGG